MKINPRYLPHDGTNYMWVDPAGTSESGGKNWFALWGRVDVYNRLWIYREWPCIHIPVTGVGLPGAWAEPGMSKQHKHGGLPGPGSKSFSFGLRDYKAEFARLEGWHDARADKDIKDWSADNGARERIYMRYLDKRFGNTPHQKAEGNTTLQDEMSELGMWFELITGHASQDGRSPIDHGIDLINDALSFEPGWEDLDIMGQVAKGPKLFICEDCTNLWFALKAYTSQGGHKEATKDPIDVLRYALHSKPVYIEDFLNDQGSAGRRASSLGGTLSKKTKHFGR